MKNIIQSQLSEADQTAINGLITNLETALDAEEGTRYGTDCFNV